MVKAMGATSEAAYLHLVLAAVAASQTAIYGLLNRNRPEWQWYSNIGATLETVGYQPMTPEQQSQYATRDEMLAARIPLQDKVTVPVSLLSAILARLEVL